MQQCPVCATEFEDELTVCPGCGAEVAGVADAVDPAAEGEVYRCTRCEERFRDSDACPACGFLRETVACERHPDRTAVGRCVICGQALCGDCRAGDTRAFLCSEHGAITVIEGWAQVYSTASEFEASLVRQNLEAEGIDARIFSQRDRIFSVDLGELSIVRLLVPVFAYDQALTLIRDHMDTGGEVAFACASCGEAYELGARECTACGSPLS
jgi:hypothetical protein